MRRNNKTTDPRTTVFLIFLSVLLVFTSLPAYGMETPDDNTAPAQDILSPAEDVFVIAEDTTKRSEFEKHYYCSDGSFVAVTYPESVHYQDTDGSWIDVDNRPALNNVDRTYEMENGDFKVSFPNYSSASDNTSSMYASFVSPQDRLVTMETGDYVLSWSLTAQKPLTASGSMSMTATSNATLHTLSVSSASDLYAISELKSIPGTEEFGFAEQVNMKDKTVFELPRASGKIAVNNIFGADEPVSVEYTVYRNKIEEDIYIHAPTDIEAYSMVVNCGELTPYLNEDNSVDFLDEDGEMIYHISIPYMVDAVCEATQSIEVSLIHKGSECVITYTPDQAWLNDEARVYPVMLDPSVTTNEYTGAIYDTYVEENTTTNHSSEQALYISKNGNNRRKALIFVHKLPSIDPSVPITSATLTLNTGAYVYTDVPVKLESFNTTLFVDYINYSTLVPYTMTTVATDTLVAYSDDDPLNWDSKQLCFDLTDHISTMYQQISTTFAARFALSLQDENSTLLFPSIYSVDATDVSLRPYLTVTYGYTIPDELKNDCIIALYNGSSMGYLYPHSGLLGNNNNILHYNNVSPDSPYAQFILSKNPATGGYTLTPAVAPASGYKVTADTSTKRVYLHSDDDPSKQEWLIVPHMYGYRIVLRTDMQYALTAVGSPSGYNNDQTITTDGHVILKKFTGTLLADMMWHIQTKSIFWSDVIALNWHITGSTFEAEFTVRESSEYDLCTFSTSYTGDHGTNIYLYNQTGTILSGATHINETEDNLMDEYAQEEKVPRASIMNYPLSVGIIYRIKITQYDSIDTLNCYFTIRKAGSSVDRFEIKNYSEIPTPEGTIDYSNPPLIYNCTNYAISEYLNHVLGTDIKYNNHEEFVGYDNENDTIIRAFQQQGFTKQDYYSPTCIILYLSPEGDNAHYALSLNGVITAKLGYGPLVKHASHDPYFNSYWTPICYFVISE
ncbi:MAG: hypothetical protein IJD38_06920 [Clostridia bacterium]|nr:hypothetical protein [Clostridia bacterium]